MRASYINALEMRAKWMRSRQEYIKGLRGIIQKLKGRRDYGQLACKSQ